MKIKVEKNNPKIKKALEEVQARAKERTLDEWEFSMYADTAEKRLEKMGIAKKYRTGATAYIGHHKYSDFPAAYRWRPAGTVATIKRFSSGWYIVHLERLSDCRSKEPWLKITDNQKEIACQKYIEDMTR